jgi:GT2 family glycosyltransferase
LSPKDTYPQHIVTAVIVAHDGAAWLPHVIQALLDQTRPVQRVVAVDTGSRDRSGSVLASQLGAGVVFGMERSTGYGTAVRRALQHRAANVNVPGPGQPGERLEWLWLLHDDSEPAPDALEQLLRGAAETRNAAVLGPKVREWADRRVLFEAGVTIDTAGRRITGIDPREVDQGQHDGDRDVLAVGSAGMLIRRDVWDAVGGFDGGMTLFRDDIDFCWRVHSAGHRVRVITDAVVYHAEASNRRKRAVSVARRPSQLDRRNAILTLAGNLPARPMLASMIDNLAVSALRIFFFLFAKRVSAALDEIAAVGSVISHPFRLLKMRRRRARGRRQAYARLRRDLPAGHSVRRMAELMAARSRSAKRNQLGEHHIDEDPENADFLLNDTGLAQRIMTSPGVLLFICLTVISLVAERSLLGPGPLAGGALIPAWGGASGMWHEYLQGFHPVGVGSGTSAPPYLAIVALLATVLAGKPWLAVDVILMGCVPLAGISAFYAVRRVTQSVPVGLWAAAAYALLPVGTGAIAAGRLGTAVVFILAPAIAVLAGRILTPPPRRARRAAWATAFTVAVAAAFVPLVWAVVLVAAVALAVARPVLWRNLAIATAVPLVLLLPWTIQVATNPSELLLEAGLQQPGLAERGLAAKSLLLLSPGGPGLPPVWVTAGILLAALAALLLTKRRGLVMAGWGVALSGLLIAVAVSRAVVTPPGNDSAVAAWPGVALLIPALGLLLAGVTTCDAAQRLLAARKAERATGRGGSRASRAPLRRMGAMVLLCAAFSAPVLAAGSWVVAGVKGPVTRISGPVVPPVVGASAPSSLQLRTLVLRSAGGQISYTVQRGDSPQLGDADLVPAPGAQQALATAVAELVATNGGEAVNQGQLLAQLDIGFVLLPAPVNQGLARQIDSVAGLRPISATGAFDLWRLQAPTGEAVVVEHNGSVVTVPAGPDGVFGAAAPSAGGTLELAEPAGGWNATLNGQSLASVASSAGWAQAFQLPAGGGTLDVSHPQTGRDVILVLELLAVLAVAVLALPGARSAGEEDTQAAITSHPVGRRRSGTPAPVAAGAGPAPAPGRRGRGRAAPQAGAAAHGHRREAAAGSPQPTAAPQEAGLDQLTALGARQDVDAPTAAGGRDMDAATSAMTGAWDRDSAATSAWDSGSSAASGWDADSAATSRWDADSGAARARPMDDAAAAAWNSGAGAAHPWDAGGAAPDPWDAGAAAMDERDVGAASTGAWNVDPAARLRRDPDASRPRSPRGQDAAGTQSWPRDGRDAGGPPSWPGGGRDAGNPPPRPRGRDAAGPPWADATGSPPPTPPPPPRPRRGRDAGEPEPRPGRDAGPPGQRPGRDAEPGRRRRWGMGHRADEPAAHEGPAGGRPTGQRPARERPMAPTVPPGSGRPDRLPRSRAQRPGDAPDRPAGPPAGRRGQPARWAPPSYDEQWPAEEERWESGPPPQAPSGWGGSGSDMLAPLPPPAPGRHGRRPELDDDDEAPPSSRWQVPDYDSGTDQW